jgi:hypothetical protein
VAAAVAAEVAAAAARKEAAEGAQQPSEGAQPPSEGAQPPSMVFPFGFSRRPRAGSEYSPAPAAKYLNHSDDELDSSVTANSVLGVIKKYQLTSFSTVYDQVLVATKIIAERNPNGPSENDITHLISLITQPQTVGEFMKQLQTIEKKKNEE